MNSPRVAILMCTFNGDKFIEQQLNSIIEQKYSNWNLWISDDHSVDGTSKIIKCFGARLPEKIFSVQGPGKGLNENFKSLIQNDEIIAEYFCFSDQDDIWQNDKLTRAVEWLKTTDANKPALYCSRTCLIDEKNKEIGYSPFYRRPPSFANALIQNIASGNTMVFNNTARLLLKKALKNPIVIHDWSLYLVVSACGGSVFFDQNPGVFYRQHSENLIGNGMALVTRFKNFCAAHKGRNLSWNDKNISMLESISLYVTERNRLTLRDFSMIRNNTLLNRLKLLKQSGVYHQKKLGSLTNLTYAIFNKL